MKILVTGGAGFIGSHLCDRYVKNGDTVICLDNFMNGNLMNIRHLLNFNNFKLVNGDIRNFDLLEKIMRDVDAVLHMAAQIHVDRSIIEPKLTYDINVLGTLNILEAARMYDVDKVIHASTSEVYGSCKHAPMDEGHPLDAPHPYGASKIAADRMCKAYIETYGMNICIARPFNIFGPRQKDSGYGGVISIFTKRVLNNMSPMIFGDGKQTRDYTYIDDIIDAYSMMLECDKRICEPINFGTGTEVTIENLAHMIIRLCNRDIEPVYVDPRPGEVRQLVADYSKSRALLGWEPKTSLREGLEKYIEWFSNYRTEEWAVPR
jgi:UDP-glucose 4-epimerase